jgi:16S rRNA (guanine966-N2)-methyltransferase
VQQTKELRISSGTVKNKKLKTPEIPNFRPVQEVAKQAIFAILADNINNACCLDLFAGSGNMGIEALSRGAEWCDFVDSHHNATQTIEQNLFETGFVEQSEVFLRDAVKFVQLIHQHEPDKKYDIIFMDPFYEDTAQVHLLKQIHYVLKLKGNGVIFYGKQFNLEQSLKDSQLKLVTTRRFGASNFAILTN